MMKKLRELLSNPTVRHFAHLILVTVLIKKGVITPEQAASLPPPVADDTVSASVT